MSLTFALQALLERHETNMAEFEAERRRMATGMEKLEMDKRELEAANVKAIEDNRNLLDQLEDLNTTVSHSETHIQSLTETLLATRQELQRLAILAGRTTTLEEQLLAMEIEQSDLHNQLAATEEGYRSSMLRWKKAERTIEHLQEQIDRMEKEVREERERHVEVVGRIERRTVVEKELETAAGRLKGTAAVTSLGRLPTGSNVVSHFVKDILQDNANLQIGIVELREMLMSSNQEVENLRERMMLHQAVADGDEDGNHQSSLAAELSKKTPLEALPEFHVHHHYHRPSKGDGLTRDRVSAHRKPRRKRSVAIPGIFTPPSGSQTPQRPGTLSRGATPPSSAATILSQTSVTIPPVPSKSSHRWSMRSSQTGATLLPSSVPSSPRSGFRNSSVFDSLDNAIESRPTTAGSSTSSPLSGARDHCKLADNTYQSVSGPPALQPMSSSSQSALASDPLIDNEQRVNAGSEFIVSSPGSASSAGDLCSIEQEFQPRLRRATSHESVLSLSDMQPHPVQQDSSYVSRGSRLFNPQNRYPLRSPTLGYVSNNAVISPTNAIGRPAFQRQGDSSTYHRSLLSGGAGRRLQPESDARSEAKKSNIGKRVGGWMWGKWGVAPMASTGNFRAKAALSAIDVRPPGVNQRGPVRGLNPPKRAPSTVEAVEVDTNLLRESLGEE
ncbi:MAG: hypothetical protein Q9187_000789 [Circinaria calcarea]